MLTIAVPVTVPAVIGAEDGTDSDRSGNGEGMPFL